ncbi:flagellar hook capping FlgD N-terminal domain-containing protein [Sedimentitalea nanhaiensis]|uniref:Basal-body rod modification protein FlgD n=1 Tax=Sedimentitalea nanhaiensis TaxID=999627 RepID=A0A1I7C9X8_9RHOB|nr:flagellar hook capping FlgD N-terminal domain-containing protein [Sedimentitalea nanhaiensis]SFT96230.1 flagellar basal-body rod modification protein FlgD [Sedimentitalea nanhaiensis]
MIDSTNSTASTPSAGATPSKTATPKASGLTSDFETFLKMLTAQAKYQDPLEPIDSTEYSAQLAQFSMVEQQVQTNDNLSALLMQLGSGSMASVAGWVGMEARAQTPMEFSGQPITIAPNPARTADQAFLVVSDVQGKEVQRLSIPTTTAPVQWAGVDDGGSPFKNGTYSFSVESYANGKMIQSEPAEIYGRITEAQIQDGEIVLVLDGGQAIPSTSVTALREPS